MANAVVTALQCVGDRRLRALVNAATLVVGQVVPQPWGAFPPVVVCPALVGTTGEQGLFAASCLPRRQRSPTLLGKLTI